LAPVCHGQARPGWLPDHGFPGFYPLASPAKAGLTSAFRPGFGPGLPRSGQAPDARALQKAEKSTGTANHVECSKNLTCK